MEADFSRLAQTVSRGNKLKIRKSLMILKNDIKTLYLLNWIEFWLFEMDSGCGDIEEGTLLYSVFLSTKDYGLRAMTITIFY